MTMESNNHSQKEKSQSLEAKQYPSNTPESKRKAQRKKKTCEPQINQCPRGKLKVPKALIRRQESLK